MSHTDRMQAHQHYARRVDEHDHYGKVPAWGEPTGRNPQQREGGDTTPR
jgi:hypothetical protein